MFSPFHNIQTEEILLEIRLLFSDDLSDGVEGEIEASPLYQTRLTYFRNQINRISAATVTEDVIMDAESRPFGLVLSCICVLIASRSEVGKVIMAKSLTEFLGKYPKCVGVFSTEKDKLFLHWKYVLVCLTILPPKHNITRIRTICGRLEGTKEAYTSGTDRSAATEVRMLVWETEGGIKREDREYRRDANCPNHAMKKAALERKLEAYYGGIVSQPSPRAKRGKSKVVKVAKAVKAARSSKSAKSGSKVRTCAAPVGGPMSADTTAPVDAAPAPYGQLPAHDSPAPVSQPQRSRSDSDCTAGQTTVERDGSDVGGEMELFSDSSIASLDGEFSCDDLSVFDEM